MTDSASLKMAAHVCALTGVFGIGYLLGRRQRGRGSKDEDIFFNKSHQRESNLDRYITEHSMPLSHAQTELIEYTKGHSMSRMLGSADEVQFLAILCRAINARRTLDIGVFTGYSALSIAQVLPEDGKLVALDVSHEYADACHKYWQMGGVDDKIDFRIAPALDSLNQLLVDGEEGTYDYAFIDADKTSYKDYYERCLKLLRRGGVIAIDNTLWSGKVAKESYDDEDTVAIREINRFVRHDERVHQVLLKIGDGTTICVKK